MIHKPAACSQALADGFRLVDTAGGLVPIEQFFARDWLGLSYAPDYDGGPALLSPERPATTFEEEMWLVKGNAPVLGLKARSVWPLQKSEQKTGR